MDAGSATPPIPLNPPAPPANMLGMIGQMNEAQNSANRNKLFNLETGANLAQGRALAGATDADGNVDWGKFTSNLKSDPNGVYGLSQAAQAAQTARGTQIDNQTKQYQKAFGMSQALNTAMSGLVAEGPNVQMSHVDKVVDGLLAAGFDPKFLTSIKSSLPPGGQALADRVRDMAASTEQGQKALEAAYGHFQQMQLGGHNVIVGTNSLNGQVTPRVDAQTSMSPEQQSSLVPFKNAAGTEKLAPRSQFGAMSGGNSLSVFGPNGAPAAATGGRPQPTEFDRAMDAYGIAAKQTKDSINTQELPPLKQPTAGTSIPAQGVPPQTTNKSGLTLPEGVTAGQSTVQANYQKGVADDAVKYVNGLNEQTSALGSVVQDISQMRAALQAARTGGGSELRKYLGEQIQKIPGVDKKWADWVGGTDSSLAAQQEFEKYAVQFAAQRLRGIVAGVTGSHLNQSMWEDYQKNNPRLDLDPNAIENLLNYSTQQYGWKKQEQDAYYAKKKADGDNFDPTTWQKSWQDEMQQRGIVKPETVTGEALGSGVAPLGTKPKTPPVRKSVVPGKAPTKSIEEWLGLPAAGAK